MTDSKGSDSEVSCYELALLARFPVVILGGRGGGSGVIKSSSTVRTSWTRQAHAWAYASERRFSPPAVVARWDLPEQHVVGPHVVHLPRRDQAGAVGADEQRPRRVGLRIGKSK